ncbi:MAG: SIR2 family protein [Nitrospirae bacterium]|nr:SIR2 family protein [Nitrospirota bacterium]
MSNGISLIPEVPDEIRDAVNNGTLAVFIGAGVSRLVGCEGWDALARNLVNRCHREDIINFRESETLSQIPDHKKTITICYHLFNNNHLADVFYKELNMALKEGADIETPNIYNDIERLRGLFITTNADTHFDRLFNPPNILYQSSDFSADRLDSTNLYHIHGSIRDRESLIFTVSAYMQRYTQEPEFGRFLGRIFREYTVLFLGYGVSEFEILDFILRSDPRKKQALSPRHFMLSPFYSGEDNILSYEQAYYNDLGINILGYEKDTNGYRQLIEVIKHWNVEINQVTGYLHNASRLIDEAVE